MPNPRDEEFIRFAIASGHLTEEQGQQALSALGEIEELGGQATAPDLCLKRSLLTERQVGLVHQAVAASKVATKVPRELGGFEILEKIGQGGMGAVFKARQKELERTVAVKVLSPRLARNAEFVARFLREARSAGRLSHPNIVAAIDVGESEGFYYFAMEFVDGETVGQLLAREGRLPEARALAIATEVARALDHAHKKGLIHRDIKPDNIMAAPNGRVRVTDFGLAKALGAGIPEQTDADRFMGTPAYVAPEQIRSEPDIDCRADIFSLGVTLFQMLAGELPFKGANPMAIAAAVASEPLPSIRKLRPDVSIATARILDKMTAKDRAHRYATPAELVAALESATASPRPALPAASPAVARPVGAVRRPALRRRRSRTSILVSVLIGVAANVGLFLWLYPMLTRRRGPQPPPAAAVEDPATPEVSTQVAVEPPPKAPATGEELLAELTGALDAASQFAASNPRDLDGQMGRLRTLLGRFPPERQLQLPPEGRDLLRGAQDRLKGLEGQLERAADEALTALAAKANALLDAGKLNEGLALLDAPPAEARTRPSLDRLDRLRTEAKARATSVFATLDANAKRLIEQDKLDEAKAVYAAYTQCALRPVAARAAEALAALAQKIARGEAEARKLARAAYVAAAKAIIDCLAERDYEKADAMVVAATVKPELKPLADKARSLQHFVRTCKEVWAHVGFGAKKLQPGDTFRLSGLGGKVVRADDSKIELKFGNLVTVKRLTDLKTADLLGLAASSYGTVTPQNDAKVGLFLLAERDYDDAARRIEAARASGVDVTRELDLLARFAPRSCPTCKGAKTIACPDCGGKGYADIDRHDCEVCKGRGGGRCGWCKGTGRLRCTNCGGTGSIMGGFRCMECGGTGWVKCSHCGGDGKITCKACKGTGTITKITPCPTCKGQKSIPCPDCGGEGFLPPPDLVELKPPPKP